MSLFLCLLMTLSISPLVAQSLCDELLADQNVIQLRNDIADVGYMGEIILVVAGVSETVELHVGGISSSRGVQTVDDHLVSDDYQQIFTFTFADGSAFVAIGDGWFAETAPASGVFNFGSTANIIDGTKRFREAKGRVNVRGSFSTGPEDFDQLRIQYIAGRICNIQDHPRRILKEVDRVIETRE